MQTREEEGKETSRKEKVISDNNDEIIDDDKEEEEEEYNSFEQMAPVQRLQIFIWEVYNIVRNLNILKDYLTLSIDNVSIGNHPNNLQNNSHRFNNNSIEQQFFNNQQHNPNLKIENKETTTTTKPTLEK